MLPVPDDNPTRRAPYVTYLPTATNVVAALGKWAASAQTNAPMATSNAP